MLQSCCFPPYISEQSLHITPHDGTSLRVIIVVSISCFHADFHKVLLVVMRLKSHGGHQKIVHTLVESMCSFSFGFINLFNDIRGLCHRQRLRRVVTTGLPILKGLRILNSNKTLHFSRTAIFFHTAICLCILRSTIA